MENAVQSLLQVPNWPSANIARALLLRAKGRLAAGYRTSAQQGKCSSAAFERASVMVTSETYRQIFIPC